MYQYLPNGSLEDRLARLQGKPPLSASTRLKIVKGTARGIHYLNENGYVHRDIKSANILLDSEFTAKVSLVLLLGVLMHVMSVLCVCVCVCERE